MKHHKPVILRPTLKQLAASARVARRRLAYSRAHSGGKPTRIEQACLKRLNAIDDHIEKITTPKTP